jgi:hypothetical protein
MAMKVCISLSTLLSGIRRALVPITNWTTIHLLTMCMTNICSAKMKFEKYLKRHYFLRTNYVIFL